MFLRGAPDAKLIEEFLRSCEDDNFSYSEVGATMDSDAPAGYNVDHNRQLLGIGMGKFERAKEVIAGWKMFSMPWVDLCYPNTPIETGRTVAISIALFGFYSLNAARIVYVIDHERRFGFAYGTLSEHGEIGEERFSVEFDKVSDEVWYDLYAFSRPGSLLARLGYPLTRHLQKRFAHDSKTAMLRAVSGTS